MCTRSIDRLSVTTIWFSVILLTLTACQQDDNSNPSSGAEKTTLTQTLEFGATVLQSTAALDPFDIYLVGFHPMKEDPSHQMEAHHLCQQVTEEFAQCVLFDGNHENARLNGIEYIISARLFDALPAEEQQYWHPHNYEILSGQLVAPGLPQLAEEKLMEQKMNSYGKTWHLWNTNDADSEPSLPLGDAMLGWSFNRDGEAYPELIRQRDEKLGIDTAERRKQRQNLVPLARPQKGVDALNKAFPEPTRAIPGVAEDTADSAAGRQH